MQDDGTTRIFKPCLDEMQICSASHPDPSTYGTLAVVLGELRVKYQIPYFP